MKQGQSVREKWSMISKLTSSNSTVDSGVWAASSNNHPAILQTVEDYFCKQNSVSNFDTWSVN